MKTTSIIAGGIVFILVGLAFCGAAVYLSKNSASKKSPISKPGSVIFYIIGAMTLVMGVLALVFGSELTKSMVRLACFIYLVALVVLFAVFCSMLKVKNGSDGSSGKGEHSI
ncbi:MAG: hypothetical protein J5857_05500 [Treponema sp.]|nr:hypothetical protein [Treponema sp.]